MGCARTSRRRPLAMIAGALAAVALPGAARPQRPMHRLGILRPTTAPGPEDFMARRIPASLRQLGYVEGQNLEIIARYAQGRVDRLPALARELLERQVDAIVAVGSGAVRAAMDASARVPVVMFGNFDPVAAGFVASLSRPGGNVTGVLIASEGTLAGKKLELLKEAVPRAARVSLLVPSDPGVRPQVREVQRAAAELGLDVAVTEVHGEDYARAFSEIASQRVQALFVAATTFFVRDRRQIIELAMRHRLPAIWEWPEQVEDGGLMAYGGSLTALYRRVAEYVDRILRGARAGDLPVELPTRFELVINAKTARAIGLDLPPSLLLRADRVIR